MTGETPIRGGGPDVRPGPVTVPLDHTRHNHDGRRYGNSSATYAETTGAGTSQETVSIPASLIEQEQAQESQNQEYPVVQDVIPPRPLGL